MPPGFTTNGQGGANSRIVILVSVGGAANPGSNSISVTNTNTGSTSAAFPITVTAPTSMKLEQVGPTVISTGGLYSEDTTIRVTAVRTDNGQTLTGFTGTVNIGEDGTAIYGTIPQVNITSGGTTTFEVKSLAGPKSASAKPDDAMMKTTNYPIYSGNLSIPQWITSGVRIDPKSTGSVFDWVQARTKDIYTNGSADVKTVIDAISSYTIGPAAPPSLATTQGSAVTMDPYQPGARADSVTLTNCGMSVMKFFHRPIFARSTSRLSIQVDYNSREQL